MPQPLHLYGGLFMKRKILTWIFILSLCISLFTCGSITASADGENTVLSSVEIAITEPVAGGKSEAGQFYSADGFSASIGWSTSADGGDLNDFNNQIFEAGNTYYADIYLTASDTYEFKENTTVTINGTPYTSEWVISELYPAFVAVYDVPFYIIEKSDLYVGGVAVTNENASDVLLDGTVSYDANTKTLTLNNANITEYFTETISGEKAYYGIYSIIDGLNIVLVGDNKIAIKNDKEDDTAMAIYSSKPLTVSGEGSVDIKCWSGMACMDDLLVKDCKMSFSMIGITGMKDVDVEGATLSAGYALIMAPSGDITLKDTIVSEGGLGSTLYTDLGKIYIENSSITANADESVFVLQDALTIKNSTLNLSAKSAFAIYCGQLDFDGVNGSIKMNCNAGYGICAGDVRMKNCKLDISIVATNDSAMGIISGKDQRIENSEIKIDVRASKDIAMAVGTMGGNVNLINSKFDLVAKSEGAYGLYGANVSMTDCYATISATAIATEGQFGAGILAEGGYVKMVGCVVDITVSGPVLDGHKISSGINMTNTLLNPELTDTSLKIKAPVVMTSAPYLALYGREYVIEASEDIYCDTPTEYNKDNIKSYKYFHIHGAYTVLFDSNGGEGNMESENDVYGNFTLPENSFIAPNGKQFKAWAIGSAQGENKNPGDNIEVAGDIAIFAIWEDIPIDVHTHDFGSSLKFDGNNHWNECNCGEKDGIAPHTDANNDGKCDVCEYGQIEVSTEPEATEPEVTETESTGAVVSEAESKEPDATEGKNENEESSESNAEESTNVPTNTDAPKKNGLGVGAIIGIVIAAIVVLEVGGFAVFWFVIKKKTLNDLICVFKKK